MTYEEYLLRQFKIAIGAALGDLAKDKMQNEFLDSNDVIDYRLIDEIAENVKHNIYRADEDEEEL